MTDTGRIYAVWAGNRHGIPENKTRCVQAVSDRSSILYQCSRKRGFGEDGLYCKQHAKRHPTKQQGE